MKSMMMIRQNFEVEKNGKRGTQLGGNWGTGENHMLGINLVLLTVNGRRQVTETQIRVRKLADDPILKFRIPVLCLF